MNKQIFIEVMKSRGWEIIPKYLESNTLFYMRHPTRRKDIDYFRITDRLVAYNISGDPICCIELSKIDEIIHFLHGGE